MIFFENYLPHYILMIWYSYYFDIVHYLKFVYIFFFLVYSYRTSYSHRMHNKSYLFIRIGFHQAPSGFSDATSMTHLDIISIQNMHPQSLTINQTWSEFEIPWKSIDGINSAYNSPNQSQCWEFPWVNILNIFQPSESMGIFISCVCGFFHPLFF